VAPILKRLAPGSDAGALLGEVRERITDELDYEIEAQHQRRLARLFRGHPHVYVPRVHTDLSTQRVLVTEYVDGLRFDEIARLDETARDRIGEIVVRFLFGLVWREQIVAGDPHPDNCLLCQDGCVCVLDFGFLRGLDAEYLEGERDAMRAIVNGDPHAVHDALGRLGYLAKSEAYDPAGLLEHLATAGEWFLAQGFRRIDPDYVRRTLELGYPPRSPWFSVMRRLTLPPPTLLLRRMELQMLSLLGGAQSRRRLGGACRRALVRSAAVDPAGPRGRSLLRAARQRGLTRRLAGIDQKGAVSSSRSRRRTLVCSALPAQSVLEVPPALAQPAADLLAAALPDLPAIACQSADRLLEPALGSLAGAFRSFLASAPSHVGLLQSSPRVLRVRRKLMWEFDERLGVSGAAGSPNNTGSI
jgi:ABC1 atypical kinase-like domain